MCFLGPFCALDTPGTCICSPGFSSIFSLRGQCSNTCRETGFVIIAPSRPALPVICQLREEGWLDYADIAPSALLDPLPPACGCSARLRGRRWLSLLARTCAVQLGRACAQIRPRFATA